MKGISLKDIIDVETLQKIQDNFSAVTKLAAVTVDFKGEPITKYSNFTNFCTRFREIGACKEHCYQSDAFGGIKAARSGKPAIYRCHAGLYDMAVPIIFEGQFLGSILAGQVHMEEGSESYPGNDSVISKEAEDFLATEEAKNLLSDILVTTDEHMMNSANLLSIMGNYVVKNGFAEYIQNELNEKNQKLINEMKVRMSLEKSLSDAELKVLKSQVNPHFLFNALNTISNLSIIEKADKTTEVIYFLSDMLRYTIRHEIENLVTIEQELDYVKKYLRIQQIRMGHKLDFSIDVDPSLLKLKMPFMILQPIVNNAIDHGIYSVDNGIIRIYSEDMGKDILLIIEDNGVGMEEKKIEEILSGKYDSGENTSSNGIGLLNSDKRLIHQFGSGYRLKIESEVNQGTKISIKIPRQV
ncbi:PocR ligand-binding domain-containing protein [Proteiniclasticum sp. SCR006]|uniref:histidine kinase n=1 Tax=Proteiniclasticum aestuarii TaxID=2817862 RepID=A0A939H9V5_9CLOT|nr:PocR ligand-binding domain-containing protein [Proteiniclasticum aestuarii]MBO1264052.1 PocR ligand-binding domain-containing protein [Proteiniclasticum aestuarii]